jgi:hypothetical protein
MHALSTYESEKQMRIANNNDFLYTFPVHRTQQSTC